MSHMAWLQADWAPIAGEQEATKSRALDTESVAFSRSLDSNRIVPIVVGM